MTVANPEAGEIFWADDIKSRLRFVGRTTANLLVFEPLDDLRPDTPVITLTAGSVRDHLVVWTEETITLEPEQLWRRSRHDYAERSARILAVVLYGGENFVIYEEFYSHSPNPKMKREIDFRRVYGRLVDPEGKEPGRG